MLLTLIISLFIKVKHYKTVTLSSFSAVGEALRPFLMILALQPFLMILTLRPFLMILALRPFLVYGPTAYSKSLHKMIYKFEKWGHPRSRTILLVRS